MRTKFIDLSNQKFDMLTVINYVGINDHRDRLWLCSCDCGNTITVTTAKLHLKGKI